MRAWRLLLLLVLGAALLVPTLPVVADDGDEEDADDDGKGKGKHGDDGKDRGDDSRDDDEEEHDDESSDDEDAGDEDGDDRKGKGKHGHDDRGSSVVRDRPVRKAGPPHVRVAQDYSLLPGVMTYTFTVSNTGAGHAQDVHLEGQVPAVADWALADPGSCQLDGTQVACDVGDLAPGASRTVAVQGVVAGDLPAFTNVVQVYTPLH